MDLLNPNMDPDPAFQVNLDPDQIRIQGFDDQKLKKKNTAENFVKSFFDQKLQFTYPLASIMDIQAAGEASALQKEHPALQK